MTVPVAKEAKGVRATKRPRKRTVRATRLTRSKDNTNNIQCLGLCINAANRSEAKLTLLARRLAGVTAIEVKLMLNHG